MVHHCAQYIADNMRDLSMCPALQFVVCNVAQVRLQHCNNVTSNIACNLQFIDVWLAQLVEYQSIVREVVGLLPGWTNTQGFKIIEEKVLPL